jgi:hypothetical protein
MLVSLVILGTGRRASAQARYLDRAVEPQLATFHLAEISAGVYAEGEFDQSSYKDPNLTVSHSRWFVGPSLGLVANGTIYHPNLLQYDLSSDGAFGYSSDTVRSTVSQERNELEYLGHFASSINLLANKPYHATAFANYDHMFRDNDFFNRVTVDSWRYGARATWELEKWTFNADYYHSQEESTTPYPILQTTPGATNQIIIDQKMVTRNDTATMNARNERSQGGSTASYIFNRYTFSQGGQLGEGTDNTVAVGDAERFGQREQFKLNSNLSYTRRDTTVGADDDLFGGLNLSAEHNPHLNSYYDFNYEHFDAQDFSSDNYSGSASLNHQLYESLSSSVTARASDTESSSDNTSGYTRRYGGGFSEAYNKRLSTETKLHIGNALFLDHTDQKAISVIENERHTIGEASPAFPDSFYLAAPNVLLSTIVITDARNVQQFIEGFDYQPIVEGSRTRIQWLFPPGQPRPPAVLASYRTLPTPEGSYETLTESFQIRVDLWKNLVGVYGRINLSHNNAPKELHVLDFTSYTAGTDLSWRFLRAGAEYEIYDSSDSSYRATRLFQSLVFRPDEVSTLSFDFSEMWLNYLGTPQRHEEDYRFITRFHRTVTWRFGIDFDAGVSWRGGLGDDQLLAVVRPTLRYVIGKTSIDAGYDYEYNLFLNREERQKSMFFARLRRVF